MALPNVTVEQVEAALSRAQAQLNVLEVQTQRAEKLLSFMHMLEARQAAEVARYQALLDELSSQ